jgi:Uncharacterized protein conserved in bacteria (DUF2188)
MMRDAVYYVMPVGGVWLVRRIGCSAEVYPKLEDALAAAERLAARGGRVRVLAHAGDTPLPGLARTSLPSEADDPRTAAN